MILVITADNIYKYVFTRGRYAVYTKLYSRILDNDDDDIMVIFYDNII